MTQTRTMIALALFAIAAPSYAASSREPVEYVIASDGKAVYYIMSNQGTNEIEARSSGNSPPKVLLAPRPSNDPKQNLTGFSHLFLSPDGKMLFFETYAWATSGAIHALNLTTKKVSYVTDGELHCVVLGGQYQGDLVVTQHRYYVQGGSYDSAYLYSPSGSKIGMIGQAEDAAAKACPPQLGQ